MMCNTAHVQSFECADADARATQIATHAFQLQFCYEAYVDTSKLIIEGYESPIVALLFYMLDTINILNIFSFIGFSHFQFVFCNITQYAKH